MKPIKYKWTPKKENKSDADILTDFIETQYMKVFGTEFTVLNENDNLLELSDVYGNTYSVTPGGTNGNESIIIITQVN